MEDKPLNFWSTKLDIRPPLYIGVGNIDFTTSTYNAFDRIPLGIKGLCSKVVTNELDCPDWRDPIAVWSQLDTGITIDREVFHRKSRPGDTLLFTLT